FLALAVALTTLQARAQTSPAELAQSVVKRWSGESSRAPGLAEVVRTSAGHAVVLISGVALAPNSGDATIAGLGFSSAYEARSQDGRWRLGAKIPLEDMGQILAHHMKVSIRPA